MVAFQRRRISNVMDHPYDLVLCLFVLVIAAVMLVAGELYLANRRG
jgi:hypothetical protein